VSRKHFPSAQGDFCQVDIIARAVEDDATCADSVSRGDQAAGYLERLAVALETLIATNIPVPKRPSSGAAIVSGMTTEDRAIIKALTADVAEIKSELAEIKELLTAERGEVVKEAYTVEEVAKKTKYAAFTLRQACNKGRIKDARKGKDGAWRIPHASLLDIINNGLPPE
jgi:hypothetical protein